MNLYEVIKKAIQQWKQQGGKVGEINYGRLRTMVHVMVEGLPVLPSPFITEGQINITPFGVYISIKGFKKLHETINAYK